MAPTPRLIFNDDGWILGTYEPPLTPDIIREKMIAPYADSPVDVFLWSVGGHDVYDFETEIGERFGDSGCDDLDDRQKRRKANLHYLRDNHGGPLTVISNLCHDRGLRFFPSVRMNEHYDMAESSPSYGRLRRENPDFLIGKPGEEIPHLSLEWGIRTGLDYAVDEARNHKLSVILELIEHFDIDGIELDFMRHPAFFRVEEAYAHRYLMTDMVSQVRSALDARGRALNREVSLAIRVPPTLHDCIRIGLDVEDWLRQDLVHLLIAGGGFIPFHMPIRSFVDAARGSSCGIFGCFEALRPLLDEGAMRALAARYWDAGVDGLYFFNYYSMSAEWKRDFLAVLADPGKLRSTDKEYQMDSRSGRPTTQLGFSFENAVPRVALPARLAPIPNGGGLRLTIDIADDVTSAVEEGNLGCCSLGLEFEELPEECEVTVAVNGQLVPSGKRPTQPWHVTTYDPEWNTYPSSLTRVPVEGELIEFEVTAPPLRQGSNEVEISLVSGTSALLRNARVWIRYMQS